MISTQDLLNGDGFQPPMLLRKYDPAWPGVLETVLRKHAGTVSGYDCFVGKHYPIIAPTGWRGFTFSTGRMVQR